MTTCIVIDARHRFKRPDRLAKDGALVHINLTVRPPDDQVYVRDAEFELREAMRCGFGFDVPPDGVRTLGELIDANPSRSLALVNPLGPSQE